MRFSAGKSEERQMMTKTKKLLCALLSVCVISASAVCSASSSASAQSVETLSDRIKNLDEKNKEYQEILEKTESDIADKEEYNEALVEKIDVLNEKIELTRESISENTESISQAEKEIEKSNGEIEDQLDALCERLRAIYMAGSASDLEIILGAKDFTDFIDKMALVKNLSKYDDKLIEEANDKLNEIKDKKEQLEADKAELEKDEDSLSSDLRELSKTLEDNKKTLEELYKASDDAKDFLENSQNEQAQIEAQIKKYFEGKAKNYTFDTPESSGYIWPCPGFYYLTSLFGEDRTTYSHGAIDIAEAGIFGAEVVAVADGTVIYTNSSCIHNWGKEKSCGCGGGFGNYVWLDHGGGKETIYGHLTALVVSPGDKVKKGQVIGYVGSTGNSTGPHLHFECRYNGVKYDPLSEYSFD